MMETIAQISQMMDNMKVPDDDVHSDGSLSWNLHTICNKLSFNHGSKLLTRFAGDAFDLDIIAEQFKKVKDSMSEMVDDVSETKHIKLEEVQPRHHYMVFYFQSWSGKGRPVCFVVARYCLAS